MPGSARIKRREHYLSIQNRAQKLYTKNFILAIQDSQTLESHIGTVITTKLDKRAVRRNRIRRYIKEFFRLNRVNFVKPIDLVVIAKGNALSAEYEDVVSELTIALTKAGMLSAQP